jgi:hypothetical protein
MPTDNDKTLFPFLQPGASAIDACYLGTERLLKQWLEHHIEAARFLAKRGQRNLELLRKLHQCRGPEDFPAVQQQWQKETGADYSEEFGRLIGVSFGLTTSSLAPLSCVVPQRTGQERKPGKAEPLAA